MVQRQIEKVVTSQLLEATRDVLDHLRKWQNHLSQSGEDGPPDLSRIYGSVRRLRDYLHRVGVSSYTNEVPVDLSSDDENLLVSCAVHHIGTIECDLGAGVPSEDDRTWLEGVRKNLSSWAVNFASRPVARIPTADTTRMDTPTARNVVATVARNTGDVDHGHSGPGPSRPHPLHSSSGAHQRNSPFGRGTSHHEGPRPVSAPRPVGDAAPAPTFPMHGESPPGPSTVPMATPPDPAGVPPQSPMHPDVAPMFPSSLPPPAAGHAPAAPPTHQQVHQQVHQPAHQPAPGLYPGQQGAAAPGQYEAPEQVHLFDHPQAHQPRPVAPLLEPRLLRDPRLRTIVTMDAGAFERTASAEQYRLAMVHLSSVLEGAVVDFALPRQKELGIGGLPESWSLEAILDRCLGDRLTSMDRPHLLQMVAARHLVRPAVQLNSPMAVTAATLDKAADFVRRVLAELGYAATQPPIPDPSMDSAYGAGQHGQMHQAPPPGMGGQPGYAGANPGFPGGPGQAPEHDGSQMRSPPPPWGQPGR